MGERGEELRITVQTGWAKGHATRAHILQETKWSHAVDDHAAHLALGGSDIVVKAWLNERTFREY